MNAKTLTRLLAGALVTSMCLWPTEGLTMNADANKIYVPRGGDDWRKLPKNPNGWEAIPNAYAPIHDIADWQKLVEKRRKNHWKPGKSAYKTAHSWFNSNPDLPREIKALLGGTAKLFAATPEHETPLPGKGSGSHSDVLAFINMRGEHCAVTVEGKVDEKFDDTVDAWLKEASSESSSNNRTKRLNGIYDELGLTNPAAAQIRYQLLHRAAAAVIEAKRFNADCATMIVQSFSPKHQWFEDFAEFLKLFGIGSVKRDMLYETGMPGMPLYFGWASPPGTVAVAETPAPQPAPAAPAPAKPEIQQVARVAETTAPSPEPVAPTLDKPRTNPLIENFVWILLGGLALVGVFFGVRKWKGADADSKAAQHMENAPAQTVDADDLAATDNDIKMINANKVKGDKFENYVVSKFNMLTESEQKDRFLDRHGRHILLEHRSDKGKDGVFPESSKYPDLEIGCYLYQNKSPHKFAVECKFRSDYMNDKVHLVSQEKLAKYKKYARENDIPTFIVLGVGGYSDNPQRMFVIPLDRLKENDTELTTEQLADYVQPGKAKSFFYHCNDRRLKFN